MSETCWKYQTSFRTGNARRCLGVSKGVYPCVSGGPAIFGTQLDRLVGGWGQWREGSVSEIQAYVPLQLTPAPEERGRLCALSSRICSAKQAADKTHFRSDTCPSHGFVSSPLCGMLPPLSCLPRPLSCLPSPFLCHAYPVLCHASPPPSSVMPPPSSVMPPLPRPLSCLPRPLSCLPRPLSCLPLSSVMPNPPLSRLPSWYLSCGGWRLTWWSWCWTSIPCS